MRMKRKDSRRIKALFVSCALCVLTAAVLSMQGCTARTSRGKNMKIGVVVYNQTDTFLGELLQLFQKDVDGLRRDGEETAVLIRDAAGSQRTEDAEVRELHRLRRKRDSLSAAALQHSRADAAVQSGRPVRHARKGAGAAKALRIGCGIACKAGAGGAS